VGDVPDNVSLAATGASLKRLRSRVAGRSLHGHVRHRSCGVLCQAQINCCGIKGHPGGRPSRFRLHYGHSPSSTWNTGKVQPASKPLCATA